MTQFLAPPSTCAAQLQKLVMVSEPKTIIEGTLLQDVSIRAPIRIRGHFRDGQPFAGDYSTSPVCRLEDGYVQTAECIYQIVRVPGPPCAPARSKPAIKATERTTIPREDYFKLRDNLFSQMEALAPELALIQAIFRLHQEQFATICRGRPDELTGEPISDYDLYAEFTTLQDALCFRYSGADKREHREKNLWVAGHRLQATLWGAIQHETSFIQERGHLALFTGCQVRLQRMLIAWENFASLLPEGAFE